MKEYLIVSNGYPSKKNLYNNAFIHSRVKNYQKNNLNIKVFIYSRKYKNEDSYTYEGVNVITGNLKVLANHLSNKKYNKILIHFAYKDLTNTIIKNAKDTPLLIWVHGSEALGWYRRLFAFDFKRPFRFFGYIILNTRQLIFMHNLIKNKKIDKTFIFVSEWMKNILEKDSFSKNKIKKYTIIPNVIDNNIFYYNEKKTEDRLKILSIRPYTSKKYANDLSVKAVLELSKESFFNSLTFDFYGDGKLFNRTLAPLKKFKNINIYKKFLNQKEIVDIHKMHGIILIPTRQDAQGVSMCEAMSSGLVPITSNNTAIPEYVNEKVGFLTNNYKEIVQAIKSLYYNEKEFMEMSKKTSKYIQSKCCPEVVIKEELNLINK